jgi:hypothetical protein
LCRRLNIREAEDELLSLAESLNREEPILSVDWDLMSEILSALSVIGTRKSQDFLLQQLTDSPSKEYQKGAFTALQSIDLPEALKYLPKFAEVSNESDNEDFFAILYGLLYAVDEAHLDLLVNQFTNSSKRQGEYLEKNLRRTKANIYLDKINYVLIFKYRCWSDLKPREIAELLHIEPNEVFKKWFVLKHEFLIPLLIEKGILKPDCGGLNELYIAAIPCDTRVWLELPKTKMPSRKDHREYLPTKLKVAEGEESLIEVRQLAKRLSEKQWRRIYDTERGELWTRLACLRVYPARDKASPTWLPTPQTWLILREDEGENELKYQLCHAPEEASFERLAEMSHSRYWMERAIQDAKRKADLDEHRVRIWYGWYHHMMVTLFTMIFLLESQVDWNTKASNLTVQGVREILKVISSKHKITLEEIIGLI